MSSEPEAGPDDEVHRAAMEAKIFSRLDKRYEEKQQIQTMRQLAREEQQSETVKLLEDLDSNLSQVHLKLSAYDSGMKDESNVAEKTLFLDTVAEDLNKLEKFFAEKASVIPMYEVKRIQNSILEIRSKFQEVQSLIQPKKKFAFKGNKKKATEDHSEAAPTIATKTKLILNKTAEGFTVSDKSDCEVLISEADFNGGDLGLARMRNCVIRIDGRPATLHIVDVEGCVISSKPVKTSIFLEMCSKCTFVIACQQLRVHEATDSDFYLLVTSKGIIEDSSRLRFAPPPASALPSLTEAGLDPTLNNWDKIDDFNWLASDQPSPHWSIMPESERRSDL